MIYILLNLKPIIAATLAALLFGVLWLSLAAPERLAETNVAFVLAAALAEFWLCAILAGALILAPKEAGEWTMAIGSAVVIWVGFVLPALIVTLASRGIGWGDAAADALHWFGAMVVMAVVLKGIGVSPPPGAPQ